MQKNCIPSGFGKKNCTPSGFYGKKIAPFWAASLSEIAI